MSANRANINWHLRNLIGGDEVPNRGAIGYAPGAPCFKTTGRMQLGLYINRGTKESCDFRGLNGQSPLLAGGAEQLLYEEDLTQNYDIGAKEELPDGREFRYCKSTGAGIMQPNMGCNFTDTGYISYTSFVVSAAKGDVEITIPADASHAILAKDALRGGYVVIFDGSGVNDVTHEIVGNDASAALVAFKVRLATPLSVTITAADACEVYSNPWSAIAQSTAETLPKAGAPMFSVTAAATHFWLQTKGAKFINPYGTIGADNGGIAVCWRHDGSIDNTETSRGDSVPTYSMNQPAGVVMAGSKAGNGPLINLTGF
ncbi:hypothetical protein LCGC14_0812550 [marine sediment metagenome]|uniref:Uncharacterized protein n=1 Tax=marine sediment metagenome TaxID=412755 RepID=A0A0F9PLA3_9ZZZZ